MPSVRGRALGDSFLRVRLSWTASVFRTRRDVRLAAGSAPYRVAFCSSLLQSRSVSDRKRARRLQPRRLDIP